MPEPVNSFLLFCKDYRTLFASSNPGLSNCEVTSLLAKEWKSLDIHIKQQYRTKANALKEEFKMFNPNYSRKCKNHEFQDLMFDFKVSKRSSSPIRKQSNSPKITRRNSNHVYPRNTNETIISQQPHIHLRENSLIQPRRIVSYPSTSYQQSYNPTYFQETHSSYPRNYDSQPIYNLHQNTSFHPYTNNFTNQSKHHEDLSFLDDVAFNSTW